MKNIKKYTEKYGLWRLLRVIYYPFTLVVWSPLRFLQALWSARSLAEGKWSEYIGFSVSHSICYLFYWTDAFNLNKYGRNGIVPYKGMGDADLSILFKYSLPSLYAYKTFGAVLPLLCMFVWWGTHLFWLEHSEVLWVTVVMLLGIFSTKSYAATFAYQNYNIMGWMFYPLGLWAMLNGYYSVATLAWFLASLGSITVVAISLALSFALAIVSLSPLPVLCTLPAVAKIFTHFAWSAKTNGGVLKSIILRAKAIGITSKNVRYKRIGSKSPTIVFYYFLFLYLVFGTCWYAFTGSVPVLWMAGVFLFVCNALIIRFADHQSMHMMMLGLSTALMIQLENPLMLVPYWLVVSPMPYFLAICSDYKSLDLPPKLTPYRIQSVIDVVSEFLEPVKKGQKILMAFNDPGGIYEKVFDGYRMILEIPLYVAATRELHVFPDWWAVFETNYEGAPEFWGRELSDVNGNVLKWKCDFVVVYQDSHTELDEVWVDAGYKILSQLDWGQYDALLRGVKPWQGPSPKWWLLQVPQMIRTTE